MQYAFFEGKIVPFDQAKVSIMTHSFNYGTGVFEGIRAYWNEKQNTIFILKMKEHYERLLRSAKILRMDIKQSIMELCDITVELVKKHSYKEDIYIRPIVYKSDLFIGVKLNDLKNDLCIYCAPFGAYVDIEKGVKVKVSSWRRVDDSCMPARGKIIGIYVNSAFSKTEALMHGYDEAIVLNNDGHISEGSAENIFFVRDNKLITPPVNANILEGITRTAIIDLAKKELGIEVIERQVDRSELYVSDEIFFTGTGAQISPIIEVEGIKVGDGKPGKITKDLQKIYFKAVKGEDKKYADWLTPVKK
ncbi:branched-chain amino acid transaminase [Candidatus Margulisiibacteriota bacterium]